MDAGFAIYDAMQYVRPQIETICFGIAMSMGSLLLAAGAPGRRLSLPNARILTHQPTGGYQGQATDIEIHAKAMLDLRARTIAIYARHTGQEIETLEREIDRDRFFTPEQALEYGLIDRVIDRHELDRRPTGFASAA